MAKLFKKGDKVIHKTEKDFKGTITKTLYVPKKGLSFGDFQWIYLDDSNHPNGTNEEFELEVE